MCMTESTPSTERVSIQDAIQNSPRSASTKDLAMNRPTSASQVFRKTYDKVQENCVRVRMVMADLEIIEDQFFRRKLTSIVSRFVSAICSRQHSNSTAQCTPPEPLAHSHRQVQSSLLLAVSRYVCTRPWQIEKWLEFDFSRKNWTPFTHESRCPHAHFPLYLLWKQLALLLAVSRSCYSAYVLRQVVLLFCVNSPWCGRTIWI